MPATIASIWVCESGANSAAICVVVAASAAAFWPSISEVYSTRVRLGEAVYLEVIEVSVSVELTGSDRREPGGFHRVGVHTAAQLSQQDGGPGRPGRRPSELPG